MTQTARLATAIDYAQAHEIAWPRDPAASDPGAHIAGQTQWGLHHDDPAPFNRLRGPVQARGPQSGVVWQHGAEIASWGEPARADLTFSVAKTYLALLAGVAQGRGLLPEEHEPVAQRLPGIGFEDIDPAHAHNSRITWAHLLTQTSEWEGISFGLPDTVDRWRKVGMDPRPAGGPKGGLRPLQPPGSYWEYNDVRINQLALALLHLFQRPLPEVFLNEVLHPLGGGDGFAWRGYDDAWTQVAGVGRLQSVPGGSHWGGGVSISAHDQARIGQLLLDGGLGHGESRGRQLLPKAWLQGMAEPCSVAPFYGRLLWLNRDGRTIPGASVRSVAMVGAGGHTTWIDPDTNAVVVLRWLDPAHAPTAMQRFSDALVPA